MYCSGHIIVDNSTIDFLVIWLAMATKYTILTWLRGLFLVTETVSNPWGIITAIIFSLWLIYLSRSSVKSVIVLFFVMNSVIIIGQGINILLKHEIKAPRPYVVWLKSNFNLDEQQFYQLSKEERRIIVKKLVGDNLSLPAWQLTHWEKQVGSSLPSGHTLFAASWALLTIGLLGMRAHKKWVAWIILLWAIAVLLSRLLLGMHWPGDIISAVIISWLLVIPTLWFIEHWLICSPSLREQQKAIRRKRLFTKRRNSNKF